ncbi:MAG: lysine 2,3-aminomutase [Desulfovibrio sp.]|uniref:lysine 2,3-aminomutase n=1 Tax=Desulfovibrio sp. 7SRBS1 TaxID=3378064 RepID=UPI003B3DFD74
MDSISQRQRDVALRLDDGPASTHWMDWKWHIRNSIKTVEEAERLLGITFPEKKRELYKQTIDKFPMAITPYYLSLIDPEDYENDPIFTQAFPDARELHIGKHDMVDPLHEDKDSPAQGITHRYPDRVLFHVSNLCSMYCRHCTRKRKVGDRDFIPTKQDLQQGIEYIRKTPSVRDVLLSGGDPLMLPDERLDWLLGEIRAIPHMEIIRIGSRMPVVLPYRITDDLVNVIRKHHPVWLNTHFNHPRELTQSSRRALAKLADGGVPLGNQSVLLADVNDCPRLMKSLTQKLIANRVRPYYLYQCDLSEGLSHFRTPVGKGIEIIESLIGHTTGMAVPTYVIDAPGGGGKIPVMPNYLISWCVNKVVLRNYEGVITTYKEPDRYEPTYCDRNCSDCRLLLKEDDAGEDRAIGIEKLLCDWDMTTSLTPRGNERLTRRAENGGA